MDVCLPETGDQKDLVLHGEAEHDAQEEDQDETHDRPGRLDSER